VLLFPAPVYKGEEESREEKYKEDHSMRTAHCVHTTAVGEERSIMIGIKT
jgi:hypothetical protein